MFRHTVSRHKHLVGIGIMLALLLLPVTAFAADGGAGGAFNELYVTIKSLLSGSLGKLLTILTLAVALVIAVKMQSVMGILVAVAVAICAVYGPAALEAFFTTAWVLPTLIGRRVAPRDPSGEARRAAWRAALPEEPTAP